MRYYLSPLVQDARGRWRPALIESLTEDGEELDVVTPDDPTVTPWCLCAIESEDHSKFSSRLESEALPDIPLETELRILNKSELKLSLERIGVDSRIVDTASTFGEVINQIARTQLNNQGFQDKRTR